MLYIVATPIGNLKDITLRTIETLKEVDVILCEDTRVTRKLLNFYNIKAPVLSYHHHSKLTKLNYILELLTEGRDLALVCDAGTPGISDPGGKLIDFLIKQKPNLKIIPVPGPSAITASASISGLPMDKFLFLGFPPTKKRRNKFFEEIANSKYPVIFFESPYRIIRTLQDLNEKLKDKKQTQIVVCRELTKKFEIIYRGTIKKILDEIKNTSVRGEFVIIVKSL